MFENLSNKLDRAFKVLKGQGSITEVNVASTIKEIRRALIEADVSYKVAKEITSNIKEKAMGQNVLISVSPGQLLTKIVSNELTWTFEADDKNIHVYFDLCDHSNKKADYFSAFMMSSIWRWLCWMIAKPIFLEKVEFCFTCPSISKELSQVFNSPITFNQKQNKISFSRVYLDQPIKQSPSTLVKFLKQIPENLFSHYKTNLSVKNQVKEHLEAQRAIQKSTLASVAKTFFASEQTLMRKLRKEGTSFKEIKNKICRNQACRYLTQTNKTIEQIAFILGFVDTSTFYKNFKRWSQHTPTQYRQLAQHK